MSTASFSEGAVIEVEHKTYALLRKIESGLWQAEELRTKRIQEFTEQQMRALYVEGKLTFSSSVLAPKVRPTVEALAAAYNRGDWAMAKVRRTYVMAALDVPNTHSRLRPIIQKTWERLKEPSRPPNTATVIRWKNKFLEAGRDITVLIDQHSKKGNTASRYPREVEQFVQQAIDVVYMCQERGTIQDTLDCAVALVLSENELRPDSVQLPNPTRRLVRRMIEAIPAFDRCAARHGRVAATKRFRSVHAHRITRAPLERAEIDHTLLDLLVIDEKTGLPLGRPWVTACIDDYTRCVLGLYVGFEPPSYLTVARCLKQSFLPKVSIRQDYPSIDNDWDAHGVMRELVVDNGPEFHSASLENACYSLGIEIHYSARKNPWFKGKIERFLGTLNRAVAHGNPGSTFQNIFDKEEYDPSKHAVVRYRILKEIACRWVADVYHQKVHRTLGVPPAVMWSNAIAPEDILVPDDPARLDAILGRSEERRLTHKGIELYGLLFNSPDLTALRRTHGDKLDVEIRVDAANLGQIVVFSPDKRQMFKVPALNYDYANGLSEWQHRVCKRFAAREMEQYCPSAWLEAKACIARLIDEEFMRKKQKTRTKIARYKGDGNLANLEEPALQHTSLPLPLLDISPIRDAALTNTPGSSQDVSAQTSTLDASRKKFKPVYRERSMLPKNADQSEGVQHG